MRSDAVVIISIGFQNSAQVRLAQDNDVVHALTPDRSDQPFHKAILPGRGWCNGCETARDLTPNRLPTVTLVGLTISRLIQCVTARGMGSNFDADRTSDPTPNNTGCHSSLHRLRKRRPSTISAPSAAAAPRSCPFVSALRDARVPPRSAAQHTSLPIYPWQPSSPPSLASRRNRITKSSSLQIN